MVKAKKCNLKRTNSFLIFINITSKKGMKFSSYRRYLKLLYILKNRFKKNTGELFKQIFVNVEILVYIYRKKVGGSVYQIPLYLQENRRLNRGFLILLKVIQNRKEKIYFDRIKLEIIDLVRNKGATINYRNNIYLLAADNRLNLKYILPKVKKPITEDFNIEDVEFDENE